MGWMGQAFYRLQTALAQLPHHGLIVFFFVPCPHQLTFPELLDGGGGMLTVVSCVGDEVGVLGRPIHLSLGNQSFNVLH